MSEYEIIDCHCHAHRNASMGNVWRHAISYGDTQRAASVEALLAYQELAGINCSNLLRFVPLWEMYQKRLPDLPTDRAQRVEADRKLREMLVDRLRRDNAWAAEVCRQHPRRLTFFCGVDPGFMDSETAVDGIRAMLRAGARGVKIVPVVMHLYPNDPKLIPVYEAAQEYGVPVLSQSGSIPYWDDGTPWGHPKYFEELLRAFPRLNFILAHLGHGAEDEVIRLSAKYPNIFTDTSHRLHDIGAPAGWSPAEAVSLFRHIGIDRVLFGTNCPVNDPVEYVRVMMALPLTEEERRQIFAGNFRRLVREDKP